MQQRYVVSFFYTFLLYFFRDEASCEIVEADDREAERRIDQVEGRIEADDEKGPCLL